MSGRTYAAFVDPSGGASDSMVLAIAHRDGARKVIVDCIRERRAPFDPDEVTRDMAAIIRSYGLEPYQSRRDR